VTLIEASKLLSYQALSLRDKGLPHKKETAMAKWYAAECAVNVMHEILLIFGNEGYSEKNAIEQRLRDAIGLQIGDGTAEIMKLIIAREIMGRKFIPTM
jgi:cyclohexanecarboxyl-CoA dehydrogenase